MASTDSLGIFTPSKTVAWRAVEKLCSISGRLSRAVRAARAELLERRIKPTFFRASGTKKCKWRQRVETARMATSSVRTPRFLAIFSATEASEIRVPSPCSAPRELAMRSISETKLSVVLIVSGCVLGLRPGEVGPSESHLVRLHFPPVAALPQEDF